MKYVEVIAENGICPVNLKKSPTGPQLLSWFNEVRAWGLENGRFITKSGIICWLDSILREFDPGSKSCKYLERHAPEDEDCDEYTPGVPNPRKESTRPATS